MRKLFLDKKKGVKISKSEYTLRSNRFQPIVTPDGAILRARKEARRRFRMARPPPFDLALVQPRAVRSAAHGGPRHPSAKFTHEHFPPSFLIPGRTPAEPTPILSRFSYSEGREYRSPPVESLPSPRKARIFHPVVVLSFNGCG